MPPGEPGTTWHKHYRARVGDDAAFDDRLFDPAGLGPPIWFQQVPETKAGKNRLHLDLYPTGRDDAEEPFYYVVMHDPEGNEFCVS